MQMIYNRSLFLDKQLIKMQENPNDIPEGETPHTVSLFARQVSEGVLLDGLGTRSILVSSGPSLPRDPPTPLSYHRTSSTWPSRAIGSR